MPISSKYVLRCRACMHDSVQNVWRHLLNVLEITVDNTNSAGPGIRLGRVWNDECPAECKLEQTATPLSIDVS